jgi:hypothetical protein
MSAKIDKQHATTMSCLFFLSFFTKPLGIGASEEPADYLWGFPMELGSHSTVYIIAPLVLFKSRFLTVTPNCSNSRGFGFGGGKARPRVKTRPRRIRNAWLLSSGACVPRMPRKQAFSVSFFKIGVQSRTERRLDNKILLVNL